VPEGEGVEEFDEEDEKERREACVMT